MAKRNITVESDIYTALLALAALCTLSTAVFVGVTAWMYFNMEMFTFAIK